MDKKLLKQLSLITDEEKEILAGSQDINRSLYYKSEGSMSRQNEVDASLLLARGKLIDIRPHTRFIHFPEHTHNFVEFVYMCSGSTKHIIDGQRLTLHEGDLLFMNQHARQEILPADKDDIAVNFIILPQFFDSILNKLEGTSSALLDFIISCLTDKDMGGNYLYFDVASVLPIQNLMENAIKYGEAADGTIDVRLSVNAIGDDLMVIIEDKGQGMTAEVFAHLQRLLREGENNSIHKGIYNVHRRIQLMFGMAYGLKLLQPASGGTRVEMRLPRQEEEVC